MSQAVKSRLRVPWWLALVAVLGVIGTVTSLKDEDGTRVRLRGTWAGATAAIWYQVGGARPVETTGRYISDNQVIGWEVVTVAQPGDLVQLLVTPSHIGRGPTGCLIEFISASRTKDQKHNREGGPAQCAKISP